MISHNEKAAMSAFARLIDAEEAFSADEKRFHEEWLIFWRDERAAREAPALPAIDPADCPF